jgi:hypothetical protein
MWPMSAVVAAAESAPPPPTTSVIPATSSAGAHGLAQETVGARTKGGENDVVLVESGQHDHPYLFGWVLLADPAGGFDAVDAGHPDVHQDQVDGVVPEEGDGLECVGEVARDDKS